MSAGTKADSEGTLVWPNQVNDQVNDYVAHRAGYTKIGIVNIYK